MQHVLDSLDSVVHHTDGENKVILSSIENIIYNIAQTDYEQWSSIACNAIHQRLTSNNEQYIVSGLRALKSVIQAFESAIEEERKPLD